MLPACCPVCYAGGLSGRYVYGRQVAHPSVRVGSAYNENAECLVQTRGRYVERAHASPRTGGSAFEDMLFCESAASGNASVCR